MLVTYSPLWRPSIIHFLLSITMAFLAFCWTSGNRHMVYSPGKSANLKRVGPK